MRWLRSQPLLRRLLPALVVVAVSAWAGYSAYTGVVSADRGQPNPVYAVAPGRVPVGAPVWVERDSSKPVVVPAQAVGHFPYGGSRPAGGPSQYYVQVVHFLPEETRDFDASARSAREPSALRYRVEVRAVRPEPAGPNHYAISDVEPGELIIPHYVYSLGTGDEVSGEAPSMRQLDLPTTPPDLPVIVERPDVAPRFTFRVTVPAQGWSATVYPMQGDPVPLVSAAGGDGELVGQVPVRSLGAETVSMLPHPRRPVVNVAWLVVRNADGDVHVETPLRY